MVPVLIRALNSVGKPFGIQVKSPSVGVIDDTNKLVVFAGTMRKAYNSIMESRAKLRETGQLRELKGSAQEKLNDVPDDSQERVIDYFGAATYSDYRVLLFSAYWRKLKPGGKEMIDITLIRDQVDGLPLVDFLKKRYPRSVRVRGFFLRKWLEITKTPGEDLGDLPALLERVHTETRRVRWHSKIEVPVDSYTLKRDSPPR
jgi:hypothetical protein